MKTYTCPVCGFTGSVYLDWCYWLAWGERLCGVCVDFYEKDLRRLQTRKMFLRMF